MNAFDWSAWARRNPLHVVTIDAQDDHLIRKPEVIYLRRAGASIQITHEELMSVLEAIGD